MTVTTDPRVALAEAIAEIVDASFLIAEEYVLDPTADAVLIAQIEEGNRLKREEGRLKRQREKINAAVKAGLKATGHTILVADGEPVAELLVDVPTTSIDHELLKRLAPVAYAKATEVKHGERLLYK